MILYKIETQECISDARLPSIAYRDFASGEVIAERALGKSALPTSITGFPG